MLRKESDCYFVKQNDEKLLKFRYEEQVGIYYQTLTKEGWSEKVHIYKESLEYFYVLADDSRICVFCQDFCGDIILCTRKGTEWKYKILLHMSVITPRYIRAFFNSNDIHLFYHIIDNDTHSEILVHQTEKNGKEWSSPQIITKVDFYHQFPYCIYQDYKGNVHLINTTLFEKGQFQLTSRIFYMKEGKWGKQEIIHTSLLPYIDFNVCVTENRKHYLFVTQHDHLDSVIYQYNEQGIQKHTVLFQSKKIDSCLFVLINKILWSLWTCENKLYGSISKNDGQDFSSSRVYVLLNDTIFLKAFYQECIANKQIVIPNQLYTKKQEGEEQLFLHQLLNKISSNEQDVNNHLISIFDNVQREEINTRENEELKEKIKVVEEELLIYHKKVEYEKEIRLRLQEQLLQEKEKTKRYINYNNRLKDKYSSLEHKVIMEEKERNVIEKKIAEMKKENEILQKQLEDMRFQSISIPKQSIARSKNDKSKRKFSLVKLFIEDEDENK